MKKEIILLAVLVLSLLLIACNKTNQNEMSDNYQCYTGYISLDGDILNIDEVEFITSEDKIRVEELQLFDTDMPNGYYIYNESEEIRPFILDDNTKYIFFDVSNLFITEKDDKKYTTTDIEKFREFLYRGEEIPLKTPFEIKVQEGKVLAVTEIFVN